MAWPLNLPQGYKVTLLRGSWVGLGEVTGRAITTIAQNNKILT